MKKQKKNFWAEWWKQYIKIAEMEIQMNAYRLM